ncbi:MAG: HAD family hydrolase [Alphaproteobacteria bacterium]|nr:HAD family hydrolase [Alphaproteobacteria bacterium]
MSKNQALLLDRDGVINVDNGYVGTIDRFTFMPNVFPFLRTARDYGYRLAILTNQAGVARGYYSKEDFEALTEHMLNVMKKESIEIEFVLACFEHDEGTDPAYARQSFWRKPKPGMVLEAVRRLNADPERSAFLGDRLTDMQAAEKGGIGHRLLLTQDLPEVPAGVEVVKTYDEVLDLLNYF